MRRFSGQRKARGSQLSLRIVSLARLVEALALVNLHSFIICCIQLAEVRLGVDDGLVVTRLFIRLFRNSN